MIRMLTFGAVVLCLASATGCTDLKPLQAQVDDLTRQVVRLSSDRDSLKAAVGNAAHAVSVAQSAAEQAQNRADAAASAAQAAQQSCDAINDKIDRMFKRSPQK
jgi:outer membrane murein-binding lipoprotein Lpp